MKNLHVVSRLSIYLLAIIFFSFGIFHFMHPHDLLVYVPQFLPGGVAWVYLVGMAFILGGISFLTNTWVKATSYILSLLLIIFILTIHVPNYMHAGDKEMRQLAFINILKDASIACFALHIAAGAHHQKLHLEEAD
ncbi:MAG: hypothetical protein JST81_01135 [Bacteroidetes bacterium]|nr:hypothetical protein [Bacteroidota bacterium]